VLAVSCSTRRSSWLFAAGPPARPPMRLLSLYHPHCIAPSSPGMTKNGKQKTPEWLQKALGVEVPEVEGQGKTLRDLLGPEPGQ
jgi:hypothetical protein